MKNTQKKNYMSVKGASLKLKRVFAEINAKITCEYHRQYHQSVKLLKALS